MSTGCAPVSARITTTSSFSGAFNQAKTREEFMNLLRSETKRI